MYIQLVMSQKYATKIRWGGEGGGGGNLGIEGRKKFWKNHFYKLSKTNFLMPLVQIWCNSPNN